MNIRSLYLGLALWLAAAQAHATFNIVIAQSGSDVVMTGRGSIDTTGLLLAPTQTWCGGGLGGIGPAHSIVCTGSGTSWLQAQLVIAPPVWGPGGDIPADAGSGPPLLMSSSTLYLPAGYTSGQALSNSNTFNNTTLAQLGITVGTYTYTLPSGDTIVVYAGTTPPGAAPAAVPTLGELGLAALALLLAWAAWKPLRRG